MEGAFGAALKKRREARGLTLRELSALVSYSAGWLSRIQAGKAMPTAALARACDEALETSGELVALARTELDGVPRPEQLPMTTTGFTGREEALAALDGTLRRARAAGAPLAVAVDGSPGVGKTALVVHWARSIAGRFPDGTLFADLRGHSDREPADPRLVLGAFLAALGAEGFPESVEDRAGLFRTVVAQRSLLIVLDNARDLRQIESLLPGAASCGLIVTSRRRLTGLSVVTGAERVSLEPMTPAESAGLLRAVVGERRMAAEPDSARALAERCAHLPLALRLAAEQLATHPHRPLAQTVEELAEAPLSALADHDRSPLAVRRAFDLSYDGLGPETAGMFRLLAMAPGARISGAMMAAVSGYSRARTRRLLDELVALHLLQETGPDLYWTHDLLREYAAEQAEAHQLPGEVRAAADRLTSWYLHTADAANAALAPYRWVPSLGSPPAGVEPLAFAGPGAAAAAARWLDGLGRQDLVAVVELAEAHRLPAAWQVCVRMWNWLLLRKPWDIWIASHLAGLRAATAYGNRDDKAWVSVNLGDAYRQRGDFALARRHTTNALELRQRAGDTLGEAWAYASLGLTAADQDDPDAYHHFADALIRFREAKDAHGEAVALCNGAAAAGRLGRNAECDDGFRESLAIFRALGDLYGEGMLWDRRAALALHRGDAEQAAGYLQVAVTRHRDGGNLWPEADTLHRYADLLTRTDRHEEAAAARQRAGDLFRGLGDPRAHTLLPEAGRRGAVPEGP
ncbi:ATP-binding protein [Streptomyces liangshanensis]|uniref:ATP-binding protein n=1 Tax=Streptomyces liangshanensis TaxID=2717324 RepID=UPI0036DD3E75